MGCSWFLVGIKHSNCSYSSRVFLLVEWILEDIHTIFGIGKCHRVSLTRTICKANTHYLESIIMFAARTMEEEILIFDRDILGVKPCSPSIPFASIRDISFQFNRDIFIASIAGAAVHSRTIKRVYDSAFFMNPLVPQQSDRNTCSNSRNWNTISFQWNWIGIIQELKNESRCLKLENPFANPSGELIFDLNYLLENYHFISIRARTDRSRSCRREISTWSGRVNALGALAISGRLETQSRELVDAKRDGKYQYNNIMFLHYWINKV